MAMPKGWRSSGERSGAPSLPSALKRTIVAGVGDVDQPGVHDDAARAVELAGMRRRSSRVILGVEEAAPLAQELALRREDLDAVVPGVGHIDVAIVTDGDAARSATARA